MQGKVINGFELKSRLGLGGMAEVWYAENKIGKKAAVKFLLQKLCGDANVTSRFYTEAKIMVELNHPNIRQVYDYGEIDGRPVIVMEYLDGDDLKERLKRGQRFTDEELKKWWNQLVSALNYTHSKGIIHRDIKPGNIFVDGQGDIKLLDFGIAKVKESISSTQTGQKIGTLMYMSPEQVKDSKHIDHRTDIYSLAVTFVHLITGKRPYDSDTTSDFEISEQIVYKPIDLSELPEEWRKFLAPYLEKDPNARPALKPFKTEAPAQAPRYADDEATYVEGSDNGGYTPEKQQPAAAAVETQKSSKKTILIIVLAALIVCLTMGVIWKLTTAKQTREEKEKIEAELAEKQRRIERLTEIYNKQVKECDLFLNNMVKSRNGDEADIHFIIQALKALQEIERIETGPAFKELKLTPCFNEKFTTFRSNLQQCEIVVKAKYQKQVDYGIDTEDNPTFVKIRQNLVIIQELIKQSEGGSALAIKMTPKQSNE